jgi:hypothetical protein
VFADISLTKCRYIWLNLPEGGFSPAELESMEALQVRISTCCRRTWEIVRSVLCDDSPEGHLPEELEEVDGLDTKDLLSYSFRSIDESRYYVPDHGGITS